MRAWSDYGVDLALFVTLKKLVLCGLKYNKIYNTTLSGKLSATVVVVQRDGLLHAGELS